MHVKLLAVGSLILGLSLLAGSFLPPHVVGARQTWTDQDAQRYSKAAANLHHALHGHHRPHSHDPHGHVPEDHVRQDQQRLAEARQQFQAEQDRLEAALQRGTKTAAFLKWTGIVLTVLGVIGYRAYGQESGNAPGQGERKGIRQRLGH